MTVSSIPSSTTSRGIGWIPYLFLIPLCAAMAMGFIAPLSSSAVNSFHPFVSGAMDEEHWTLANYLALFTGFYQGIAIRTLRISLEVSAITAVLAYPVALYISRLTGMGRTLLLLVYVAPWLVNVAIKAFGWILLLSPNGPINSLLVGLGLIDRPMRLLFNEFAIIVGLIHSHMMFMVLPLLAAISGIDGDIPLAAANLGARRWDIFRRIVFPLTLPALAAGLIINFALNLSAFATPALLGGARVPVLTYAAYDINLVKLNWPMGAALAVLLLVVTLGLMAIARRFARRGSEEMRS